MVKYVCGGCGFASRDLALGLAPRPEKFAPVPLRDRRLARRVETRRRVRAIAERLVLGGRTPTQGRPQPRFCTFNGLIVAAAQLMVDLVLYQAGADVDVEDPLGGDLSTEQMLTPDRLVVHGARLAECPVAWNLAGGYQPPVSKVLALHTQTMVECVRVWT